MALNAVEEPKKSGNFVLVDHRDQRVQSKRKNDDIWVDDLGGTLPTTDSLSDQDKQLLIGMLKRADKELAHLTENVR
jgi:hypothetical protein